MGDFVTHMMVIHAIKSSKIQVKFLFDIIGSLLITSLSFFFVFVFFYSYIHIHMTHVQFEKLYKYIQKRNKIYKKWYTQKRSLDIKINWYI